MRKKIYSHFMLVVTLAILLTMAGSSFLFYRIFREQMYGDIRGYAQLIAQSEANAHMDWALYDSSGEYFRLTVINQDGNVVYDNEADADSMENHSDREEIISAWETGEGQAIRQSDTLNRSTYYVALKLDENTVIRVGRDGSSVFGLYLHVLPIVLLVGVLCWLICLFLASLLTRSILQPMQTLADNLDKPQTVPAYEELQPFLETIQKQHMDLLESAQMRQEFTANVSHELKTPLTVISGYAELISSGMAQDKDARHFAKEIRENAGRLLTLINDILELSRLDSTSPGMELEHVDLYSVAQSCVEMLDISAQKHKVGIRLSGENAIVPGNRQMLEELIYNLCDNAIRYNRENGSVEITVQNRVDTVLLRVKDTGIGIPKEHQTRIFERFYRVDKSRSRDTGGTGLGLAIVKHIVSLHGATLDLESEEGTGTEITVTFMKARGAE
ncbi:MAG: ATP-binding protein [Lachnospiraceae bacterium]|nr:ATP-binding protein [Lachnospiraceae bacterium]